MHRRIRRMANFRAWLRRRSGRAADLSVGRKIGLAAGTMIPLAAVVAALGLQSTAYLENSRADVERALAVLRDVEGIDAALHRADGHELEFVFEGSAVHRDAFTADLAEADLHYANAARLVLDPAARRSLEALRADMVALGNELQAEIAAYDAGGFTAAQSRRQNGAEAALEARLEASTAAVVAREEQLLAARGHTAAGRARAMQAAIVGGALALSLVAAALGTVLTRHLTRRLRRVMDAARSIAAGDLGARAPGLGSDEIGLLAVAVNDMAASLEGALRCSEEESGRARFARQLSVALERSDDERAVAAVASRALARTVGDTPTDILVADSSTAHLKPFASHPGHGAPGCGVVSPWSCPAVRAGRALVFASSGDLDACPHLSDRPCPSSAVCVPVTAMGRAFGVLHATGPDGRPPAERTAEDLEVIAAGVGARLGAVRAAAEVEGQARTDGLTGFLNRRTIENELRALASSGAPFALAMVDLDKFKTLNDTYGHEAGDRALRIFAEAARAAMRTSDLIGRWGGEEFVLALPGCGLTQLLEGLARLRAKLGEAIAQAGVPVFTASFGATDSTAAPNVEELLRMADAALLDAKAQGRDRVVVAEGPAARPEGSSGPTTIALNGEE